MNRVILSLAVVLVSALQLTTLTAQEPSKKKADPARIQGMKAALADIEKGFLKLKTIPPPAPPWYGEYLALVKKECGVDVVNVNDAGAQMQGYNALMMLEIEHRFGKGILEKLGTK